MISSRDRDPNGALVRRYGRDTPEFARVANLSDAVFAIAMTLLVLALDAPDVPADRLAAALAAEVPRYVAFVLSFVLVANVWWAHHKFFALVAWIDPGSSASTSACSGWWRWCRSPRA